MVKACVQGDECGTNETVPMLCYGAKQEGLAIALRLCMECNGYVPLGPSTDYESLDRREKQLAYEMMRAATDESKPERRLRRNHMKSKWVLRHSQIKGAAKKRGVPKTGIAVPKMSMRRQRQAERIAAVNELFADGGR